MLCRILGLIFLQILGISCFSQVINNRIQNRILLKLDSGSHTSFTTDSNVEWDCINKSLTNKCLIYHNDQWFTIKPSAPGPLYLNVSKQNCKKLYGVQIVIIEGDPCKTASYRLKKCIPFTDQLDFFVRLDSLDPKEEYLINIDGYLGDLCRFEIEFSSNYRGIPIENQVPQNPNVNLTQKDSLIQLEWSVHDSLSFHIRQFHIYRKKEKEKSAVLIAVPMVHNAYGAAQKNYHISDTLHQWGAYTYSIYGSTSNGMMLLSRQKIVYNLDNGKPVSIKSNKRQIEYYVRRDCLVNIHVLDEVSEKRLFSTSKRSTKGRNTVTLDFTPLMEKGIYAYTIILESKDFKEERYVRFDKNISK